MSCGCGRARVRVRLLALGLGLGWPGNELRIRLQLSTLSLTLTPTLTLTLTLTLTPTPNQIFERIVQPAPPSAATYAQAEPPPEAEADPSVGMEEGELSFKEEMWCEDANDFVPSD